MSDVAFMAHQSSRRGRFLGTAWAGVWLWPLIVPATDLASGKSRPVLPGAIGLAAFVVIYLVCVTSGFYNPARRPTRRQLVQLAALTLIGLGLIAGYTDSSGDWAQLLLYTGAAGAAVLLGRYGLLWVAGNGAALVAVGLLTHQSGGSVGSSVFTVVMACMLVIVAKRLVGYIHQLQETQAELAGAAVAEERLRFARDLHELLGHTLTLIVVKAQVVRRLAHDDPERAAAAATDIEQIGRQALIEVRETVTGYRERGFTDELDGARDALTGAGIEVDVDTPGGPLPPVADKIFGWTVREGATNVIRHSGAGRCTITVRLTDGVTTLEVRDDGHGQPGGTGNGLRGLRERLAAAGGALAAGPDPSGGFRLVATLPANACLPANGSLPATTCPSARVSAGEYPPEADRRAGAARWASP